MVDRADLEDLPGAELVLAGLADARAGRETVESLLVAIAAGRLRAAGLDVPDQGSLEPELQLYRRLCRDVGRDAYGRYNALLRRLVSFERALEGRVRRRREASR